MYLCVDYLRVVCSCACRILVRQSVVVSFIDTLISLMEESCKNWVRFKQFYLIFAEFATFGDVER